MYLGCARSPSLFEGLQKIDEDLAARAKARGCPDCGGPLDYGRWTRKPRGYDLPEAACRRHGLCCRREGCRRRVLPPSTLFMGRRVYLAAVVLVLVVVRQRRLEGSSARRLREMFGVSHRTLRRWVTFFETVFPRSRYWKLLRGRVPATVHDSRLPEALLASFETRRCAPAGAVTACLKFLAGRAGAHSSRGSWPPQKMRDSVL